MLGDRVLRWRRPCQSYYFAIQPVSLLSAYRCAHAPYQERLSQDKGSGQGSSIGIHSKNPGQGPRESAFQKAEDAKTRTSAQVPSQVCACDAVDR